MLSIEPYGSNQTLVCGKGCTVLYSYKTPVALVRTDGVAFRTGTKYSVTTSKHINKFLLASGCEIRGADCSVAEVPQEHMDQWEEVLAE